jgi:hypothetical protein
MELWHRFFHDNMVVTTKTLIISILILVTLPLTAQKAFVNGTAGEVILFRANDNLRKIRATAIMAYGEVLVTGAAGKASIIVPGGWRITMAEQTILGFFFSGPGTDPQPFFEVLAGSAVFSRKQGGHGRIVVMQGGLKKELVDATEHIQAPFSRYAGLSTQNDIEACRENVSAAIARHDEREQELETEYESATAKLSFIMEEYRSILAGEDKTGKSIFLEETLFPAQDRRSAIISEIRYRMTASRALRRLVLAPLHIAEKTLSP